jgi:ABC-2 type transport system permease protein
MAANPTATPDSAVTGTSGEGSSNGLGADLRSAMSFELTKIFSVRSSLANLATFAVITLGYAAVAGSYLHGQYSSPTAEGRSTFDAVATGFSGMRLGVIALVVFGVLTVSSEYTTGTIASSLTAVPRRGVFYAAKMLTGSLIALIASAVVVPAGYLLTETLLGDGLGVQPGDGDAGRALVFGILFPTMLTAFAMGLAAVLRSSALSIGILMPLLLAVSTLMNNIPGVRAAAQFLPDIAGGLSMTTLPPSHTVLGVYSGFAVLACWTAAAVVGGYVALHSRDA